MLTLRREAEHDLQMAYSWYESVQAGLGNAFLDEIDGEFLRIESRPRIFRQLSDGIRRGFCKKFPYAIYFSLSEHGVEIVAVLHQRQSAAEWQGRVEPPRGV